jgi:hypothetical protein
MNLYQRLRAGWRRLTKTDVYVGAAAAVSVGAYAALLAYAAASGEFCHLLGLEW